MNKKLLISTAIALGATSVVASQTAAVSVLTKENISSKNVKDGEEGVTKVKTSQGKNTSLVVLKDNTSNEQWIETWGDSGDTLNGSSTANKTTKGMLLGREYYLATDPTPGTDDIKDYYYSPGEVVFKDASNNPLAKGTYTVTDAFLSSFNTGMAVIRYADNGDGNYDPSGKLIDHIFVWGYSTKSYLLGAGGAANGYQTPHMIHAEDRPSGFEGDNIIELLNSGEYHVEKLYPSRGEGASFISIVDNSGVKRLFGWGYNAAYATLVDSTNDSIAFPEECTRLTDESGNLLLNNYNIVDFFSGKSGGMVQFTPIDDPTNLKKSKIWVYGSSATFIQGGSGNTQGFLDDGDTPDSGLIKKGVYTNDDVNGNEHDFYDVINNENTYIESFDIAGDYLVLGLYNGINDKEEIYFTGRQNAGLGFDSVSSNRTYWKDISSNFDPLVTNGYLGENNYKIKDLTLSMNHSTAGNNTDFSADPTASVVFEDSDGNDSLYMWGSNGKINSIMGNNGQSDGLVGNDAGERPVNTTEYFPSYNEGDSFQINETFISSSFVTVFVTEFGVNKIYNWGDNSLGQFGLGSPDDTPSSSSVPYLNDRTPTVTFQIFNPTKDSIKLKYKIKKFSGINLVDSAGNPDPTKSIIATGTGLPAEGVSLLSDPDLIASGETKWADMPDVTLNNLEQGQSFNDWNVQISYVDTYSQTPTKVVTTQFKVPKFSTTKDLSLTNESIKEVTAESDITDNNPIDETADIVAGERYLDISAIVDNSDFTPITEEMMNKTKVYSDLTSGRTDVTSREHEQLNIVQINSNAGSYVKHNYATDVDDAGNLVLEPENIIKDKTVIDFVIKEPEDMKYNSEFSNFQFEFADGYKGLNEDGSVPEIPTDDFYTTFESSTLDIKLDTEAASIASIGTDNGDNTFTFSPNEGTVTDNGFEFDANINNIDNVEITSVELNASRLSNLDPSGTPEDVVLEAKAELPDGTNAIGETTYKVEGLTSNSTYTINSVMLTSKDSTSTLNTVGSVLTTLPVNGAIVNPVWSETTPNYKDQDENVFGKANPILTFDFKNEDKADIKNLSITYGDDKTPIKLKSDDFEIVSFTEEGQTTIKNPSLSDITYTDGSVGATHAIKSGQFLIKFKNISSQTSFKNISIDFETDYVNSLGTEVTNHYSEQPVSDLIIGKTPASAKMETLRWVSSTDSSAKLSFDGYDPDAYDNKTATIVLNDGTNDVTKEISNNDIIVSTATTKGLGELKTFTINVDGLSESTTYTVKEITFDDVTINEFPEVITFQTLAHHKKPFPWWIIIVLILLMFIGWLIFYFLPEISYQYNYHKELHIMKKEWKESEALRLSQLENQNKEDSKDETKES